MNINENTPDIIKTDSEIQAEALKKESQKWGYVYLVLVILGIRLAGIGGLVAGIFMAYGLSRVNRNALYTKSKKILYSILYVVVGVCIAIAISTALMYTVKTFYPELGMKKDIESGYQIPAGYTAYKNANLDISSLAFPEGWTIKEGNKEDYMVNFQSPDRIANITVDLVLLPEGQSIDYKTYSTEITKELTADPRVTFEQKGEMVKDINGRSWLLIEGIIGFKDGDVNNTYYNRGGILKTGKGEGRQFFQFLMETDKEHSAEDFAILDKVIESARFYK